MLNDLLRTHDGVITLAQAASVGLSDQAVRRRVRAGEWSRRGPGVYFVEDRPFDDGARIRTAVLSFGEAAVASGLAAAWWHGVTTFAPDVVEVTVPRNSNGRKRTGSRLRRRDLAPADIVEHRGLPVTALPLTVIEAAVRRGGGPTVVDVALQRHTDARSLWAAHLRNKGRYGSPRARMMLQATDEGTRSAAERLFARLLRQAGITGWKANQIVEGYEVDFLFDKARVVIEIDGFAYHSDSAAFQRDRKKQNALVLARHTVFRYTWFDLDRYPDRVIAEVKRVTSA